MENDMVYWVQKIVKMYRIAFLVSGLLILSNCSNKKTQIDTLPYYNEANFEPIFLSNPKDVDAKITHQIGNFSFLNQDSVLIDQSFVEGKIHVANFIFTSCGSICPNMTRYLKKVADSLADRKDIAFLSFSVTPWIDKPSVLKEYIQLNGINNPQWQFLTGNKNDIYTLARKSYFAEEDIGFNKDSSEFLHTEHFILVDKNKRIRGIYNGTLELEMNHLIDDILSIE
jgi:protein SCO1/2